MSPEGMESLNDYPGYKGLLSQLERGISVSQRREKIEKALRQMEAAKATFSKIRLEHQVSMHAAEKEIETINLGEKKLRKMLRG